MKSLLYRCPCLSPLDFQLDKCRLDIVLKLRRKCGYPTAGDRILTITALPDLKHRLLMA